MNKQPHALALFLAGIVAGATIPAGAAEPPQGWSIAGSSPTEYEYSRDTASSASGKGSAVITAKPTAGASTFGTLMQTVDAADFRGSRLRLSASMRTQDAMRAQLWMRVDGADGKVLAFDNMDSRPIQGTTDWKRHEIVLDVPQESRAIAYGFFIIQRGKVWADGFKLEKVDNSVPVTSGRAGLPRAPVNADFEQP